MPLFSLANVVSSAMLRHGGDHASPEKNKGSFVKLFRPFLPISVLVFFFIFQK